MITYVGLSFGSTFWGIASDIIGRRPAFNATLFICGVFGAAVAAGPSWIITSLLFGCMGLGVGGNLPVDGALFLEFLPFASNKLLTLLSVWWPVGQLVASLSNFFSLSVSHHLLIFTVAWAFIPPYSCDTALEPCFRTNNVEPCCAPKDNRGWRYFIATLGVMTLLMFVCRFFLFHLFESPKFLLSRGRQAEAVSVVQSIAQHNGTKTWLTDDVLEQLSGETDDHGPKLSVLEINKRNLRKFSMDKVESLFITRKLGWTTVLLWFIWATIGMGFPLFNAFLPQYLEHAGKGEVPVPANVVSKLRILVITLINFARCIAIF
jgi:MFS family permease